MYSNGEFCCERWTQVRMRKLKI